MAGFQLSINGRFWVSTEGQFLSLHHDGEQSYEIGISGKQSDRWLDVRHSSTRASVRYQLPWSLSGEPKFVAVTQNGRRVMLASEEGNVMLLDVEK